MLIKPCQTAQLLSLCQICNWENLSIFFQLKEGSAIYTLKQIANETNQSSNVFTRQTNAAILNFFNEKKSSMKVSGLLKASESAIRGFFFQFYSFQFSDCKISKQSHYFYKQEVSGRTLFSRVQPFYTKQTFPNCLMHS